MARYLPAEAMYQMADLFRDRCLANGRSLLWPNDEVWTPLNISEVVSAFDKGVTGSGFFERWRNQLDACSQDAHKVAADVLVLYELILWPGDGAAMRPSKKMSNLETVMSWKLANERPDMTLLKQAFNVGCTHPGVFYLGPGRPWQLIFFLEFARAARERGIDPTDPVACKRLADDVKDGTRFDTSAARHLLLHLLFPDFFEPMIGNHKHRLAEAMKNYAGEATDLDDKIFNIRQALFKKLGKQDWPFYDDDIRPLWQNGDPPEPPVPDPELKEIADLLETRTLKDADILTDSGWRKLIIPVTRPFLKSVAELMNKAGSELKYHTGGEAKTKRDSFDRGRVELEKDGARWPAGPPTVVVAVGYADEPQNEPNFEKCVVWGLIHWPLVEQATTAYQAIKEFMPDGYDIRLLDGMKSANYPGKNVVAFKHVPAAQLRDYSAQQLASEIAGDLSELLQVLAANGDPSSDIGNLINATNLTEAELREIESLLREKRQIILEGPPGSGKTFVAEKFARYFTDNPLEGDHDGRLEIVQFHQSYGYEDFVQGIRPETNEANGQLEYHVRPGIFMRLCEEAAKRPDERFVIIIDEINRGNISRIFGELLLLLEYRDKNVRLPYAAKDDPQFAIPDNVYVIGTMNTTDRSLAQIDYALRRRFYFYRMMPVKDGSAPVLEEWLSKNGVDPAKRERVLRLFIALNRKVQEQLDEHFQVGHSYFMAAVESGDTSLTRTWDRAIMPLLEEYFYNRSQRAELLAEFGIDRLLRPDVAPSMPARTVTGVFAVDQVEEADGDDSSL